MDNGASQPTNTITKSFDLIRWAAASVIVLVFGAVAPRVYSSCEMSSIDLMNKLEVKLGGCQKPEDAGHARNSIVMTAVLRPHPIVRRHKHRIL